MTIFLINNSLKTGARENLNIQLLKEYFLGTISSRREQETTELSTTGSWRPETQEEEETFEKTLISKIQHEEEETFERFFEGKILPDMYLVDRHGMILAGAVYCLQWSGFMYVSFPKSWHIMS